MLIQDLFADAVGAFRCRKVSGELMNVGGPLQSLASVDYKRMLVVVGHGGRHIMPVCTS